MLEASVKSAVLISLVGRSCDGQRRHATPGGGFEFGWSIVVEDMGGREGA